MIRSRLSRNMVMSGLQSAAAIAALFLSYRLVLQDLGREALGLWSLLTALTLVIRLFDPTGAATIGRFVAIARKEVVSAESGSPSGAAYIDTALVLMMLLYSTLALLAYIPVGWLLESQLDDSARLASALHVLPFLLCLMVVSVIAATNSDAIDGIGRADIRAAIMIASYFVQLALVWWLLPRFQLAGFALAQIGQYLFVTLVARGFLRHHITDLGWVPRRARRDLVRELIGYGAKLQLAALASVAADPLLRLLINHYSGLSLLGIYELAYKLVFQLRALLVSSLLPLIPQFASRGAGLDANDQKIFHRVNRLTFWTSLGVLIATCAAAPLLSLTMFGKIDIHLFNITAILAAGFFFNTISVVHYLQAQAEGRLFWNIIGQFSIGTCLIVLGPIIQFFVGPIGVIVAYAIGLTASGVIFKTSNTHYLNRRSQWN